MDLLKSPLQGQLVYFCDLQVVYAVVARHSKVIERQEELGTLNLRWCIVPGIRPVLEVICQTLGLLQAKVVDQSVFLPFIGIPPLDGKFHVCVLLWVILVGFTGFTCTWWTPVPVAYFLLLTSHLRFDSEIFSYSLEITVMLDHYL